MLKNPDREAAFRKYMKETPLCVPWGLCTSACSKSKTEEDELLKEN